MSLCSEPPSVTSQIIGTLTLEQSRLRMHIVFDLILRESCGWATLDFRDVS
jgi:hypothetical protein